LTATWGSATAVSIERKIRWRPEQAATTIPIGRVIPPGGSLLLSGLLDPRRHSPDVARGINQPRNSVASELILYPHQYSGGAIGDSAIPFDPGPHVGKIARGERPSAFGG
jgi:hypothetical protein